MKPANMKRTPLIALSLLATISHAQIDDPLEEIKACARTPDRNARAACYESLGRRAIAEEPATLIASTPEAPQPAESQEPQKPSETPEPAVTAEAEHITNEALLATPPAESLPDDLGGTGFAKNSDAAKNQNRERVTSCRKDLRDKWHFYFESGQVWTQVDSRRRKFRDCNFMATISRDTFGYKMQIDGKKGKIRISRKR